VKRVPEPTIQRRCSRALLGAIVIFMLTGTVAVGAQNHSAASKIRSGGSISARALFSGGFSCLDPQKGGNAVDIQTAVFDTPLSISPKGQIQSNLFTSWKYSHGGKQITFTMRHGLRFSNGNPLTSDAIKYTYDRALTLKFPGETTAGALGPVKSIQTLGKYAVRFVMNAPFRALLTGIATEYIGNSGILDPKATKKQGTKTCLAPVGSGPFKIASTGPGVNTVNLVRNNNYSSITPWIHNHGRAYLKGITFQQIVSDSTAASELLSGQLDISQIAGDQLNRVKGNKNISLHKVLYTGELMMVYNQAHRPLNNPAVRRALAEAINRKALIQVGVGGLAIPALSPMPVSLPYYSKAAAKLAAQYNPSKAAKALKNKHVPTLTLLILNDPSSVANAQLIQAELAQVGVNVKIKATDFAGFLSSANAGKFDLELQEWSGADPDVAFYIYDPKGGYNWMNHDYKAVDQLVKQGDETLNQKKAAAAFAQVQIILNKDTAVDPLYTQNKVFGVRSRVGGFHTTEAGLVAYQDLYIK
jgi:peptide/nickel transport system substrate-binding protein